MAKWTPEAATAAEQKLRDFRTKLAAAELEAGRRGAAAETARLEARADRAIADR